MSDVVYYKVICLRCGLIKNYIGEDTRNNIERQKINANAEGKKLVATCPICSTESEVKKVLEDIKNE